MRPQVNINYSSVELVVKKSIGRNGVAFIEYASGDFGEVSSSVFFVPIFDTHSKVCVCVCMCVWSRLVVIQRPG